jgi:outer membrane receptor protein involved in Fe transport
LELGVNSRVGKFAVGGSFTYLDATYRSDELVNGEANSSNDAGAPGFGGNIEIHTGDRIPLTPQHLARAYAEWTPAPKLSFDADVLYVGGSTARGNENGAHAPDGLYYLGPGATPGYTVLNLGAQLRPAHRVLVFAELTNVADRKYYTASQLAATGFTATGAFNSRPFATPAIDGERPLEHATFYAPGAPRMLWAGVRIGLGRASPAP